MPDYFTHAVAAEMIYEKLDGKYKKRITDKTLFMLGAQGGDIFFTYTVYFSKNNLGRRLHAMPPYALFEKLIDGNASFAAGFATHYALDSTLHPDIYAFSRSKRSKFAHLNFENDLGLYVSRKFGVRRQIIPREKLIACTSAVYDTIKLIEGGVTLTGTERCLKRFFALSRYLYRKKRQSYRYNFDYSSLSDKIDEGIEKGVAAVKCVLDKNIDPELFDKKFLQKYGDTEN